MKSNNNNKGDSLITVLVCATIAGFVFALGLAIGIDCTRREAARQNVGRYVADPVTGHSSFVWGVVTNK